MGKVKRTITILALLFGAVFAVSMFVLPWFLCKFQWGCVQDTWDRWQAIIVGALAFLSSVVAFNIASYNADKQTQRELQASKAFLPDSLSELCSYFELCAGYYKAMWNAEAGKPIDVDEPVFPKQALGTFEQMIRHARPEVGEYLASFLRDLQVHRSRLESSGKEILESRVGQASRMNLIWYFYGLGVLQSKVNRTFPYARNEGELDTSALTLKEIITAYKNMGLDPEDIAVNEDVTLVGITERRTNTKKD